MIEYIKEKYKDFMYIEGMPEDKNNVPFSDRLTKMSLLVTITGKYDTINKRTRSI